MKALIALILLVSCSAASAAIGYTYGKHAVRSTTEVKIFDFGHLRGGATYSWFGSCAELGDLRQACATDAEMR